MTDRIELEYKYKQALSDLVRDAARIKELEDENRRLREALLTIANDTLHKQFAIDTAKEALKETTL